MESILNYCQLTDLIATSGQPGEDQFALIANAGYETVVNLAMPAKVENTVFNEGSIVAGLGMNYFYIPVPWESPELKHLRLFTTILDALKGQKVWVHCMVNARVSAFMYQYLTQTKGIDSEAAKSPLLKKWETKMEPQWQQFMALKIA